jgi:hypothetical protein
MIYTCLKWQLETLELKIAFYQFCFFHPPIISIAVLKIDDEVLDFAKKHQISRTSKNDESTSFNFTQYWVLPERYSRGVTKSYTLILMLFPEYHQS